jgi:hypothetical protein
LANIATSATSAAIHAPARDVDRRSTSAPASRNAPAVSSATPLTQWSGVNAVTDQPKIAAEPAAVSSEPPSERASRKTIATLPR